MKTVLEFWCQLASRKNILKNLKKVWHQYLRLAAILKFDRSFYAFRDIFGLAAIQHWIRHTRKPPYPNFCEIYMKTTCPPQYPDIFLVYYICIGFSADFEKLFTILQTS